MIQVPQCHSCARKRETPEDTRGIFCDAFPDGVPLEVMFNRHWHSEPYPGDNGILFEPKEGASLKTLPTNAEARASRKELLALMLGEKP